MGIILNRIFKEVIAMVRIGQKAPEFNLESTQGQISLKNYQGKYVVLFFYPLDFTPV